MNISGIDESTKIYLILSIPSSDIIITGWTTRRSAKINRSDLVGFFEAFFIAVEAKT